MAKRNKPASQGQRAANGSNLKTVTGLRIIGGHFRGRKLQYSGDERTRPMKDRVREALFNLLGYAVKGKLAIDLFAGTGALALEALSRGGAHAIAIELHRPTARLISDNAKTLDIAAKIEVFTCNTFLWAKRLPEMQSIAWIVFCSPPYDFYVEKKNEMLEMLNHLVTAAPPGSMFAVEADDRFDFGLLPAPQAWDVRRYPPATLGIWEKKEA